MGEEAKAQHRPVSRATKLLIPHKVPKPPEPVHYIDRQANCQVQGQRKPFSAQPSTARLQHSTVNSAPKQLDWKSSEANGLWGSQIQGVAASTLPGEFPKPVDLGSSQFQSVSERTTLKNSQIQRSSPRIHGGVPKSMEFQNPSTQRNSQI